MNLFLRQVLPVQGVAWCADIHEGVDEPVTVVRHERNAHVEHGVRRGRCALGEPHRELLRLVHHHGAASERVAHR